MVRFLKPFLWLVAATLPATAPATVGRPRQLQELPLRGAERLHDDGRSGGGTEDDSSSVRTDSAPSSKNPLAEELQTIPVITIREPSSAYPRLRGGEYGTYHFPSSYHEDLGVQIGRKAKLSLLEWYRTDSELRTMREWVKSSPDRRTMYDGLVNRTSADFPGCVAEMRGMARGAGLDNEDDVVMSNLRNELYMLMNYGGGNNATAAAPRGAGRSCTDAYLVTPGEGAARPPFFAGFAHNDDWAMDWRNLSYIIELRDARGNFKWSSWAYPSFLPGMDFLVNRHGLMGSVQTLMPKYLVPHGASAWGCVTRRLLEARSREEALRILRWPDATAGGFAVNLGWHFRSDGDGDGANDSYLASAALVNVETYVDPATNKTDASSTVVYDGTGKPPNIEMHSVPKKALLNGSNLQSRRRPKSSEQDSSGHGARGGEEAITYFHGNEYIHAPSDIAYHPSESTRHRRDAFLGAEDTIVASNGGPGGLRDFMGNTSDDEFPVYRTARPTDEVWTEATGLFDVGAGVLGFFPRGRNPTGRSPNVVCAVREGCQVVGDNEYRSSS